MGKLLWHRLDYNTCAESPNGKFLAIRKFLFHEDEYRYLPAFALVSCLSCGAGMVIVFESRLTPKVKVADCGFVVNFEKRMGPDFLNKGGVSHGYNSIEEDL